MGLVREIFPGADWGWEWGMICSATVEMARAACQGYPRTFWCLDHLKCRALQAASKKWPNFKEKERERERVLC